MERKSVNDLLCSIQVGQGEGQGGVRGGAEGFTCILGALQTYLLRTHSNVCRWGMEWVMKLRGAHC